MPLSDYMEQATLVARTELVLAQVDYQGDEESVRRNHLQRMQSALQQLEQLNQPNARHWEADVALAEWAVADAEAQLAEAHANSAMAGQFAADRAALAREHLQLRQRDAAIGWAALPSVSLATSLVSEGETTPASGKEFQSHLAAVAERTAAWSRAGAGIGRKDRVQQAELAVTLQEFETALKSGQNERAAGVLRQADQQIQQLFQTQLDFYERGTASLSEVSRTWMTWRDVHQSAAETPSLVGEDTVAERNRALATLSRLADQTVDQRGRHAADVTVVRLLEQMDGLEALRRPAVQPGAYLK
jgi:hypothetical protein